MSVRSAMKAVIASFALVSAGLLWAAPAEAAGDPVRGQRLGYTCLGCHGIDTYKNVYPTYSVPRLRGQHPEYIVTALRAYRSGERSHGTMHAHAASMTDAEIEDVAAYLGGEVVAPVRGAPPPANAPAATVTCQACHGPEGISTVGMYPTLSGQFADYLEHSLRDYKSGARRNDIMQPFVSVLTDEDIKQIAAFFARQPGLKTVPRRETISRAE